MARSAANLHRDRGYDGPMIDDDKTEEVHDEGGIGAEGGDDEAASNLPGAPSKDDDTPLGDTDQHSQVPSPPAQGG
jgi:hypothetical protein